MRFGIFSNGERHNALAADTYDEDLYEIVLSDELGFDEAWISEHIGRREGTRPDTLATADLLICRAASLTQQIRMGPAIRPICYMQPVQVALEAAACDHLTRGRYMAGFGIGGPADEQMEMRGLGSNDEALRRARMFEAIDLILKCWTAEAPFDWEGEYFQGKGIVSNPPCYQKPHVPVALATSEGSSFELAARKGFMLLVSQYDSPARVKLKGNRYAELAVESGQTLGRDALRVCRYVYVADSVEQAKEDLRSTLGPSVEHHKKFFPHHFTHSLPPSGNVEDVTLDFLIDEGHYFIGDPDRVYDLLQKFYEETGGFGVLLLLMGKDYGSREQRARSMQLFAEHVAPRLAPLDSSRREAAAFAGSA